MDTVLQLCRSAQTNLRFSITTCLGSACVGDVCQQICCKQLVRWHLFACIATVTDCIIAADGDKPSPGCSKYCHLHVRMLCWRFTLHVRVGRRGVHPGIVVSCAYPITSSLHAQFIRICSVALMFAFI